MPSDSNANTYIAATAIGLTALTAIGVYYLMNGRGYSLLAATKRSKNLKGPRTLKDPDTKYALKLIQKIPVTQDTRIFRFALPTEKHVLGLPVGQHIYMNAKVNGKLVVRPYTPTSSDDELGYVEFMIKVYFANVHPKFPEGGKMSQHLEGLEIGDTMEFRGPQGLITYEGKGKFFTKADKKDEPKEHNVREVGMIAGGTGITPMLQIVKDVLKHEDDPTKVWLIFANQTADDILLRDDLDNLARAHADRFKVWYTVDRPPTDWTYSQGFISDTMIRDHLPPASEHSIILTCGPPAMVNMAVTPSLDKLAYPAKCRFFF